MKHNIDELSLPKDSRNNQLEVISKNTNRYWQKIKKKNNKKITLKIIIDLYSMLKNL